MKLRRWAVAIAALGLTVGAAGGAPAATPPLPPNVLAAARLSGYYQANGTITQAVGVPGEMAGQTVSRGWVFASPCPSGACPLIGLTRQRANRSDQLFLRETSPGVYFGHGAFVAPASCRGKLNLRGALVPYTVTVLITAVSTAPDGSTAATNFTARYSNPYRIGLTRCFAAPSHDAASYQGVSAAAPPG